MMRTTPLLHHLSSAPSRQTPRVLSAVLRQPQLQQTRRQHAISNPTLANIEKRWEAMPPQEQADLWMALRDRMKVDWNEMTLSEKKAAYWIAFGPHGPRAETPAGEGMKVFIYTVIGVGAGAAIFLFTHHFGRGDPRTLTKEWQEATNEYFKESKIEPITGVSSAGYKGPGQVQSPPKAQNHHLAKEEE